MRARYWWPLFILALVVVPLLGQSQTSNPFLWFGDSGEGLIARDLTTGVKTPRVILPEEGTMSSADVIRLGAPANVTSYAINFPQAAASGNDNWVLASSTGSWSFSNTSTTAKTIDGSADAVQFTIKGHSTQTSNLLLLEQDAGTDVLSVSNAGGLTIGQNTTGDSGYGTISGVTNSAYYTGSFSVNFTGPRSVTKTITYTRSGSIVVFILPSDNATNCTVSTTFAAAAASVPANLRPTTNTAFQAIGVVNANAQVATPGSWRINTDGSIELTRDFAQANFSGTTQPCGWLSGSYVLITNG